MKRTNTLTLDTDWFWRKLGAKISEQTTDLVSKGYGKVSSSVSEGISTVLKPVLPSSDPSKDSVPAWSIGTTALWISTLLSAYVLIYYW
jgi:multicomponent Na+:H+ antiporter subunit D